MIAGAGMPRLTRRSFLAVSAAALAGCRRSAPAADYDCDVCIVGSGFAGMYLAQRLVEQGIRVIVLEAGPRLTATDPADGHAALLPATSAGTLEFPNDGTRSIAVGGTSRKWNGVVTRLLPSDFRQRTERGLEVDWPLSYDDLAAYYCQAEREMQVTGAPWVEGAEPPRCAYPTELPGYTSPASLLGRTDLPFFPLAFALERNAPLRLDGAPLRRLLASPQATLLDRHAVTHVELDRSGTVVALEVRRADDSRRRIRARYTVVAAGVVETVRLLLHSQQASGVALGGPMLGAGFNAHPRYRVQVQARPDLPRPDRVHRSYLGNPGAFRGTGAYLADFQFAAGPPLVDLTLELEAASGNVLTLDATRRDSWGRPVIALQADWTQRDLQTRAAALDAQRAFAAALGTPTATPALRWFHPAGACRMAADARSGVVNSDLRVFSTQNLFVAGASVFPTAGATNPTLTIVALSLRLGDHLARLLGATPGADRETR